MLRFDYYEQLADVQMLAMLSCLFAESVAEQRPHDAATDLGPRV